MRFSLCLMAVVVCHAVKVHGGLTYPEFPNLRTVHHGHGATSYQNVQIENHGSTRLPVAKRAYEGYNYDYIHHDSPVYSDYHHHYDVAPLAVAESADENAIGNHFVVSSIEPYGEYEIGHLQSDVDISPRYYITTTSNERDYEYR